MSTNFEQGLDVAGNVSLTGNIVVGGNTISGDTDTDSVTFNADVSSHIIPDADKIYSLGTLTKRWDDIFGDALNLESGLTADSAVITNSVTAEEFISTSTGTPTLSSGSDIIINPTGQVNVTSAMEVTGNLLVQGVLSNLTNWSIVEVGGVLQFQNSVTSNTISLQNNIDGTVALTSDITTAESNANTYTDTATALLDGASAGTVVNNKAVIYDASGGIVLGNWRVIESGVDLLFQTGGVTKMKLDPNGNLTVTGDVTAYGSV
tara:strand:+ start:1652 stop:2440 length:789 start_codon:yes stop_codon:yes gene_type:complete